MNPLLVGVQWIHVLLGVTWLGSALFINVVLLPTLFRLGPVRAREVGSAVMHATDRILMPVSAAVIGFGVLRGFVGGRITGLDSLGTWYGTLWGLSLALGILTFVLGTVTVRRAFVLFRQDRLWIAGPAGALSPDLVDALKPVRATGLLELLCFFGLFTAMILMRFS